MRPLSEIDPNGGPLAEFALDLRRLREHADEPTLDAMARVGGVSKAALSQAMSGKSMPSPAVLSAFVTACHGSQNDVQAWQERRSHVLATLRADGADLLDGDGPEPAPDQPGRQVRLRSAVVLIAAFTLCGSVLTGVITANLMRDQNTAASSVEQTTATHSTPRTGDDPAIAGCTQDAKVGSYAPQPDGTVLELMWSYACGANWGRITRNDGLLANNSLTVTLTGSFINAPNPQTAKTVDQQAAYTPIMVVGPTDKVCVTGLRTVDGETIETTEPACG